MAPFLAFSLLASLAAGAEEQEHWWPGARGRPGSYGVGAGRAVRNLTKELAWAWAHPGLAITVGSLIGADGSVYTVSVDGIRKFSPGGLERWWWRRQYVHAVPCLSGDFLYGATVDGHLFSLELETGMQRWSVQVAASSNMDCPYVEKSGETLLAAFGPLPDQFLPSIFGNRRIVAANASDGKVLWDYVSETVLWNFLPMFPGDGSFITMDIHGGLRRLRIADGGEVSYTPPEEPWMQQSFTDGGVVLGPGGKTAFSCSNLKLGFDAGSPGVLRAYRVEETSLVLLWKQRLPEPCVTWPASNGDLVAVATGALPQPMPPWVMIEERWIPQKAYIFIWLLVEVLFGDLQHLRYGKKPLQISAFAAADGAPRWSYDDIEPWPRATAKGDGELLLFRMPSYPLRPVCGPASWSMVTLGSDGTAYAAAMNGRLYALRDDDGDGRLQGDEVSVMDLGHASLHLGPALAPGTLVHTTCHGVAVFKTAEA